MTSVEIDYIMAFLSYDYVTVSYSMGTLNARTHIGHRLFVGKAKTNPHHHITITREFRNKRMASGFRPLQSIFQMIDTRTFHALRQLNATAQESNSRKSTCGKLVYVT